jgi:hypothetical protein
LVTLDWWLGLARTALTEEDRRCLRVIAVEVVDVRRLVMELAEKLVKMSDKELLKSLNASQNDVKEASVERYRDKLEEQLDVAEKEFRT